MQDGCVKWNIICTGLSSYCAIVFWHADVSSVARLITATYNTWRISGICTLYSCPYSSWKFGVNIIWKRVSNQAFPRNHTLFGHCHDSIWNGTQSVHYNMLPVLCGGTVLCESRLPADACYASSSTTSTDQEKEVERSRISHTPFCHCSMDPQGCIQPRENRRLPVYISIIFHINLSYKNQ